MPFSLHCHFKLDFHVQIIAIDKEDEAYNIGLPIIKKASVEHMINFIQSPALTALDNLLENVSIAQPKFLCFEELACSKDIQTE